MVVFLAARPNQMLRLETVVLKTRWNGLGVLNLNVGTLRAGPPDACFKMSVVYLGVKGSYPALAATFNFLSVFGEGDLIPCVS